MQKKITYKENFFENLNKITGIPKNKIKDYAKENNPFNILEHPGVLELNKKQTEKIAILNEFMTSYNLLRINEDENKIKFRTAADSGEYFLAILGDKRDRERFMVAFLDVKNNIIETKVVSEGSVGQAVVYPREILKIALTNDCKNIILSHNHPGGSVTPSEEDISITQKIIDIFHPLSIRVLDHIIVGGLKYSSMAEDGYIKDISINKANYEPFNIGLKEVEDNKYEKYEEEEELEM